MPVFDLGSDVVVTRRFGVDRARAEELSRQILKSYRPLGYAVAMESSAEGLAAKVTDTDGTAIDVTVRLDTDGDSTTVEIQLVGAVFVGGMKGMMANDQMVRASAKDQLTALVESTFAAATEPPTEPAPEEVEPEVVVGQKPGWQSTIARVLLGDFDSASDAERTRAVEEVIQACAVAAGAVTIQPIPIVDAALITPIQIGMVQAIGKVHGHTLDPKSVVEILGAFGASIVTQNVIIAAAKLVPFAGWAVSISLAYALTYAIGIAANRYFESGRGIDRKDLSSLFEETFQKKKKEKQAAASSNLRLKDKLAQLTEAFEAGLLTEEQFSRKKEELLRDF